MSSCYKNKEEYFFFYLFSAVSSSATPGLWDSEAPQPVFTVMTAVDTPVDYYSPLVITVFARLPQKQNY